MTPIATIFSEAARTGEPVGFTYLNPEGEVRERRQIIPDPDEPVRTNRHGERYVTGHDIPRDGPRSFHLDRIMEAG